MKRKILVVDDEKEVVMALRGYFLAKGYQMLEAFSGEEASKLLEGEKPDLILLDIRMPGVDGIEVLKTLKTRFPSVRTVIMTGYGQEYQQKIEEIGCDAFLVKPLSLALITQKIEELLTKEKPYRAKLLFVEFVPEFWQNYTSGYFQNFHPDLFEIDKVFELPGFYKKTLEKLNSFQPDILLIDIGGCFNSDEIITQIMQSSHKPKDIILYGGKPCMTLLQPEDFKRLSQKKILDESHLMVPAAQDYWPKVGKAILESAGQLGLIQAGR